MGFSEPKEIKAEEEQLVKDLQEKQMKIIQHH